LTLSFQSLPAGHLCHQGLGLGLTAKVLIRLFYRDHLSCGLTSQY